MSEEWGYVIKDSIGGYAGSLRLKRNTDGKTKWSYSSFKNVFKWHGNKMQALAEIERLKEINEIAKTPIKWDLIYVNVFSIPQDDNSIYSRYEENEYDIPFGKVGETKKAVKEICNKYKIIFVEIEKEWIAKTA